MALTITSFAPEPVIIPWDSAPPPDGGNPIPRAEIIFEVRAGSVTLGGAGNEQLVSVTGSLPSNYVYALTDVNCTLLNAAAGTMNWDQTAIFSLIQTEFIDSSIWLEGNSNSVINTNAITGTSLVEQRAYCWNRDCFPKRIMRAGAALTLTIANTTQNDQAGFFNMDIRFLMYDVAQGLHWQTNTPQLVR